MLSNIITKSAQWAMDKPAAFLRYTTAVIYLISTAAQSYGIVTNKDVPKKEKNFLLLQELVNGALELGTFLTIATGFENWGRNLVDKGVIIGEKVAKANPTFRKGVTMAFSIFGTVLAFNLVTPLLRNPIIHMIQKKFGKGKEMTEDLKTYTQPILPSVGINNNFKFNNNNPFANFEKSIQTGKLPVRTYQPTFTSVGMRI